MLTSKMVVCELKRGRSSARTPDLRLHFLSPWLGNIGCCYLPALRPCRTSTFPRFRQTECRWIYTTGRIEHDSERQASLLALTSLTQGKTPPHGHVVERPFLARIGEVTRSSETTVTKCP